MSIIPWKNKTTESGTSRESPLAEIRTEVNRLFDSFLREPFGSLSDSFNSWGRWSPALDVSQSDTTVTVRAELPGVDPNEIEITVTGERLTIAGEKKETVEKKDQDAFHRESRFGAFTRTLQLPTSVDPQQVTAEYANGVLTVTLKKTPAATAKKIPVKTNSNEPPQF
jgi:HSP20 family protein